MYGRTKVCQPPAAVGRLLSLTYLNLTLSYHNDQLNYKQMYKGLPTTSSGGPEGVSCRDYIFYSRGRFEVTRVLLLPSLAQLTEGEDPRQALTVPDLYWGSHNRYFHQPDDQRGEDEGHRRGHRSQNNNNDNNNNENNNNNNNDEEEEGAPPFVNKDFGPWSHMPLPLPSPGRIFDTSISSPIPTVGQMTGEEMTGEIITGGAVGAEGGIGGIGGPGGGGIGGPGEGAGGGGGGGEEARVARDVARLRAQIDNVLKRSAHFTGSRPVSSYMGEPQKRASSPAKAMKREQEERQAAAEANFWMGGEFLLSLA